jgi:acetyl esterase/lipase
MKIATRGVLLATLFVLTASLARAADEPQKRRTAPQGMDAHLDIEYAKPDNTPLRLDLYLPKNIKGSVPVIIAIHGGGWTGGDKRGVPVIGMVRNGYAVASINYRFSQQAIFPAQIEDCKAAVRWVRAHAAEYHIDPDRIGAWGDSAGGHLVALLATTAEVKKLEGDEGNPGVSSRVQAVCDWYGPTDLVTIASQEGPDAVLHPDTPDSPVSKLLGGPAPENKEKAEAASPITYVSKEAAPILIMHGDKDPLVPLAQSEEFRDALKKAGAEVELYVVKGAGHGFPNDPKLVKKLIDFFDEHLKPTKDGK